MGVWTQEEAVCMGFVWAKTRGFTFIVGPLYLHVFLLKLNHKHKKIIKKQQK